MLSSDALLAFAAATAPWAVLSLVGHAARTLTGHKLVTTTFLNPAPALLTNMFRSPASACDLNRYGFADKSALPVLISTGTETCSSTINHFPLIFR